MSTVISFRLSENNPREAKALEVIQKLHIDGFSLRLIFTEALLSYDDCGPWIGPDIVTKSNELFTKLLLLIDKMEHPSHQEPENQLLVNKLTNDFKNALVKSAKPGLSYE